MRAFRRGILIASACLWIIGNAFAEDIDLSGYTLEELREMAGRIEDRITELEIQDARENGDREIVFAESDLLLYAGQKQKINVSILRRTETAPERTTLIWESADPDILAVKDGTVSPLAPGETFLTAKAADDERIRAEIRVRVVSSVSAVKLDASAIDLVLGAGEEELSAVLSVKISPEDAFHREIQWSSSDEGVATVDPDGKVRAVQPGRAIITAQSTDPSLAQQKKATCSVTVRQAVTGISLSESEAQIGVRKTLRLTANLQPESATEKAVIWESSNPEIASVSAYGLVTGNRAGECVISCRAADGYGATAACTVTVAKQITKISDASGRQGSVGLRAGGETEITAAIEPEDATNQQLRWILSDEAAAEILRAEGGSVILQGKETGSAILTGEATDGSGKSIQYTIQVEDASTLFCTGKTETGVSYGYKWFSMEITNTSVSRTADGVTIRYYAEDVYGEKIKSYGLGDEEAEATFNLTIGPGNTRMTPQEIIYGFNQAKKIHAAIVKMHYTDGEIVEITEPEYLGFDLAE